MGELGHDELVERLQAICNEMASLIAQLEAKEASAAAAAPAAGQAAPEAAAAEAKPAAPTERRKIAWGAKVSPVFRDRVWWIADQLGLDPDDLMSCMAWESGESFRADKKNMAGSGATGLIQFMPATAKGLGTTTDKLAAMTAEDQLNYVYKYFAPWKGKLKTLSDIYMAILWPKAVGKPDSHEIFFGGTTAYRQNAGLDIDKNMRVTKAECTAKVLAKKEKGLRPENMG